MRWLALLALLPSVALAQNVGSSMTGPGVGNNVSISNVLATGSTTPRTLGARAADGINIRDYGAALDGVTDDANALQAARAASIANQPIYIPAGQLVKTFNPTSGPLAGTVLWRLDGSTFAGGTVPVTSIGAFDEVETVLGGSRFFIRANTNANTGPTVRIDTTSNYAGAAAGVVQSGVKVNTTATSTSSNFNWGVNSVLNTTAASGVTQNQEVGVASSVFRNGGAADGTWQFFGQTIDATGLASNAGSSGVGFESDLSTNGPEGSTTAFAPAGGGRVMYHMVMTAYPPPVWLANHVYALNTAVQPTAANGFTYVVTVAGTSGGAEPTWPLSAGTVASGTATFSFGTTIANQVSRAIDISTDSNTQLGAGLLVSSQSVFYDAVIDMAKAVLTSVYGSAPAAIRMASNMPIDFSGDGTLAGQNKHTLIFNSGGTKLQWMVNGVEKFSVTDTGVLASATVAGVSCSGSPTVAFASVGGLVTHC